MQPTFTLAVVYHVQATCCTPLRSSDALGNVDTVLRTPQGQAYLQGSSMAGALKAYALKKLGEKVPKDTLAKYTAKRKEKLYPVVCEVKAKDNRCPQCGMELSIAEQSKLESGSFIECDSCRRILFRRK